MFQESSPSTQQTLQLHIFNSVLHESSPIPVSQYDYVLAVCTLLQHCHIAMCVDRRGFLESVAKKNIQGYTVKRISRSVAVYKIGESLYTQFQ